MADQPLPNPNRYITDNGDDGESSFSQTTPESLAVVKDLSGAQLRLGYTFDQPPIEHTHDTDLDAYRTALKDLPPLVRSAGGTNVWYIDTPPDSESPMHRTLSLDLVIQIAGEIELTMSGGEQRIVKPGDLTVQRSSLHKWRNPSKTQWSRMIGVMVESKPAVTKNGTTLAPYFPQH